MSILNVVSRSGLSHRISGNHIYVECPRKNFHLRKRDETESFCIEIDTNRFFCHSCGLRGRGTGRLSSLFGRKIYTSSHTVKKISELNTIEKTNSTILIPDSAESIMSENGKKGLDYLRYDRNPSFSKNDCKILARRFNLKFCNFDTFIGKANVKDFLIIPVSCNGSDVFTCRSIKGYGIKHIHPKGSSLGSLLFNYDHVKKYKTLILVEGPFDLFRTWLFGYKNVVATFGKCVSPEQKRLLLRLKPNLENIIIMFDGEGYKQGQKLAEELGLFFKTHNSRLGLNEEPDTIDIETMGSYIFEAERILGI